VRASEGGSSVHFWLSQREMEQQQTSSNGGGVLWFMAATSPFHRSRGVHRSREGGTSVWACSGLNLEMGQN